MFCIPFWNPCIESDFLAFFTVLSRLRDVSHIMIRSPNEIGNNPNNLTCLLGKEGWVYPFYKQNMQISILWLANIFV